MNPKQTGCLPKATGGAREHPGDKPALELPAGVFESYAAIYHFFDQFFELLLHGSPQTLDMAHPPSDTA